MNTPTTSLNSHIIHELNQSDVQVEKRKRCKECFAKPLEDCHDCDNGIKKTKEPEPKTNQQF